MIQDQKLIEEPRTMFSESLRNIEEYIRNNFYTEGGRLIPINPGPDLIIVDYLDSFKPRL